MKILVVDDQETMRHVISSILKDLGFTDISIAKDGKHAYQILGSGKFDFVVSDWNMPNMTGIQLLKVIRETESIKDLPVLLITTKNQKSQVMEAARAGVNSFIVKPFTGVELLKKIKIIFPELIVK